MEKGKGVGFDKRERKKLRVEWHGLDGLDGLDLDELDELVITVL